MARLLITTLGSYGDLYPYLAIGRELRRMGHAVCIATNASYRDKVEAEQFEFLSVRPDVSLHDEKLLQHIFHRRRGAERLLRGLAERIRESYEDTLPAVRNADLVITHPISFGAVLAAEVTRRPWISTVLAPTSFVSAIDPPVPSAAPWVIHIRKLGVTPMRLFWQLGQRQVLSWVKPIVEFRRELGLPPGVHPVFDDIHAPGLVLALFSRLFAAPQADWPPQAITTGFPFYDSTQPTLDPALVRFLDAGPPPVIFTLGSSAVTVAGDFYTTSLRAVEQLRCRALFLTGSRSQNLPGTLPGNVFAHPYAPHELVFPRASVTVHQGGMGTTAQAMRAGRPTLIVPFAFDQHDNAARVCRLGMAATIMRERYSARSATQALETLLQNPQYATIATQVGAQMRVENGALTAAEAIDRFLLH